MSQNPVVLLHGALGDANQLTSLKPPLPDTLVQSFSFRGHGDRDLQAGPFGMEGFVADLQTQVEALDAPKVDLFGYSLGGYVALLFAQRFPERVGRVMTFATKFVWTEESAAKETRFLDPDLLASKVPRFKDALEARHTGIGWRALLVETAQMMRSLATSRPSLERLESLTMPVRIAVGDRDTTAGVLDSYETYLRLKEGSFHVFPQTEHAFEKANPTALRHSMAAFFGWEQP